MAMGVVTIEDVVRSGFQETSEVLFGIVMGVVADRKSEFFGFKTVIAPLSAFFFLFFVENVIL